MHGSQWNRIACPPLQPLLIAPPRLFTIGSLALFAPPIPHVPFVKSMTSLHVHRYPTLLHVPNQTPSGEDLIASPPSIPYRREGIWVLQLPPLLKPLEQVVFGRFPLID